MHLNKTSDYQIRYIGYLLNFQDNLLYYNYIIGYKCQRFKNN
jgi:hypothetical protein